MKTLTLQEVKVPQPQDDRIVDGGYYLFRRGDNWELGKAVEWSYEGGGWHLQNHNGVYWLGSIEKLFHVKNLS